MAFFQILYNWLVLVFHVFLHLICWISWLILNLHWWFHDWVVIFFVDWYSPVVFRLEFLVIEIWSISHWMDIENDSLSSWDYIVQRDFVWNIELWISVKFAILFDNRFSTIAAILHISPEKLNKIATFVVKQLQWPIID